MRITFVVRSLDIGGAERQLVLLARALAIRGHAVSIVSFYSAGELSFELLGTEVVLHELGKTRRWEVFRFVWSLLRTIRITKPQIVHSYLTVPNLVCVWLGLRSKECKVIWGLRASESVLECPDFLTRLLLRLESLCSRMCDLVVCNSNCGQAAAIKRGFPASKVRVIQNGIDTERFKPSIAARRATRAGWGVSDEVRIIGRLGRLDPRKDYPTFIRAAARVYLKRQDVLFLCIGSGSDALKLEYMELANELKVDTAIRWLPSISQPEQVYPALDLMVSSSSTEGFPNVVAEAMACGVRCVATSVGDSVEIIGPLGLAVPPNSPTELAGAILRELDRSVSDPDAERQAIRGRIVERYSIDTLVERTSLALVSAMYRPLRS